MIKTSDFDYNLPPELIAQEPLKERDTSLLLHLSRNSGAIQHRIFNDITDLLKPGDRLVFNNTKVFPARIYCKKKTGARVELLFTKKNDESSWQALVKPSRRLKEGSVVSLEADPSVHLRLDTVHENGNRVLSLSAGAVGSIEEMLEKYGEMPLPPYIKRPVSNDDRGTYQTVYAEKKGAIAAPTAGLHFTRELMTQLSGRGIDLSFVTLHVGVGTFRPVKEDDPANHAMHHEEYVLDHCTAEEINRTRLTGGRIIAVGTTAIRVLEHCAASDGSLSEDSGSTELMILPGYRFKLIEGCITNFHLPRTTLIMLVAAFTGRETILKAYTEAIEKKYRFYSYGDAMLIL